MILDALGEELGIPAERADDGTWHLLGQLGFLLGRALEEGAPVLDVRAPAIAQQAAYALDFHIARRVMIEQGWSKDEVTASVGDIPNAVCQRLALRVENKLWRIMRVWNKQKLFAGQT